MALDGFDSDQIDRLNAAGLDADGNVIDLNRFADWSANVDPEWSRYAGRPEGFGWDTAIIAEVAGAPPPSDWAGISIVGRDDGTPEGRWHVEIVGADGSMTTVPLGHIFDLAWDIYDLAGILDIDIEKDIDTGSGE